MTNNPILDELYEIRAKIIAEHPGNLRDYLDEELKRLKLQGHPIAQVKQRSLRGTPVGQAALAAENQTVPVGD